MTAASGDLGEAMFDHPGLVYRNSNEYVQGTTHFVRAAVAAGDAVLVAVPRQNLSLIRAALPDLVGTVTFADMAEAGRNPGRIIPGVLLAFAAANAGRRVSIIGEPIWPGRTSLEYPACAAHEALINAVFADRDAAILCPYDAVGLDRTVLRDAWRTHPVMITSAGRRPSPWYTDPIITAAAFNQPLPAAPPHGESISFASVAALAAVRRFITRHATVAGLSTDRIDDLVIAVNELTDNTIEHARTAGTVTVWNEPGHLVCQVDDGGYLADPLAGRVPPDARTERRRGLILANELCDLVRVHTHQGGTSIRVHMWH